MNIAVCIKQVPDVTAPLQVRGGELALASGRMVLNAYDASAVEAALVTIARTGGEVTVVLAGPLSAQEALRKALAMGADRGVHLVLPDGERADSAASAAYLAEFFGGHSFDLILCGKQSQDTDAGLTGGMLATRLNLPYATNAVDLDVESGTVVVTRQGDSGTEIIELPTPCLVTCSNDMNDPRTPNVKGIMQARKKTIEVTEPAAVESVTETVRHETLPPRKPAVMLSGTPEEQARQVAAMLKK
jgi:electron transfer flavoprotein beta subunit